MIVLLDSGPLGLVTSPKQSVEADDCKEWLPVLLSTGHRALVPAITDYEVRRELRLYSKSSGLYRLDQLAITYGFLPLMGATLLQAAEFWADARRQGLPTADRFALDADVILAAQAATLDPVQWQQSGQVVIIATTNVGHLTRFAGARLWRGIA